MTTQLAFVCLVALAVLAVPRALQQLKVLGILFALVSIAATGCQKAEDESAAATIEAQRKMAADYERWYFNNTAYLTFSACEGQEPDFVVQFQIAPGAEGAFAGRFPSAIDFSGRRYVVAGSNFDRVGDGDLRRRIDYVLIPADWKADDVASR